VLEASGRYRIRYGDIFRAVGHFLDTSLFRDLTLVETQEGFIVKGGTIRTSDNGTSFVPQSYLFTDDDLETLLDQAVERRGSGTSIEASLPSITIGDERVRYEDALRSIGLLVDKLGWQEVVLVQTSLGFHLKGLARETPADRQLDATTLQALLDDMRTGRHHVESGEHDPSSRRRFWSR
jgi:hypothetical protein